MGVRRRVYEEQRARSTTGIVWYTPSVFAKSADAIDKQGDELRLFVKSAKE